MMKAIIIDLIHPSMRKEDSLERLEELEHLVNTYGGIVVVKKYQKRLSPHSKTFIGPGKAEEIAQEGKELGVSLLIVNDVLKPRQTYLLGKTSLLNALSGRKEYADDKLFATLDTRVGELYLAGVRQKVLISDTIGFIKHLPPQLLHAFESTLSEAMDADLLLQVMDVKDRKSTRLNSSHSQTSY